MRNIPATHAGSMPGKDYQEQIRLALAIADPQWLTRLLCDSSPAIAHPRQIHHVTSRVCVPIQMGQAADAILDVEQSYCLPCHQTPEFGPTDDREQQRRAIAHLTEYESELHTLGQHFTLATAIVRLEQAGFSADLIRDILYLPNDGWFKSWWELLEPREPVPIVFLRFIRTRHHLDGTLTIQYKDYYRQYKPPCFDHLPLHVLVGIRSGQQPFSETLHQLNWQRQMLGLERVILIADRLSDLELEAFMRQGVSLYPSQRLPLTSGCDRCARQDCMMNGCTDSPVILCRSFVALGEFVP